MKKDLSLEKTMVGDLAADGISLLCLSSPGHYLQCNYDTLKIGISFVTRLFTTPRILNMENGAIFL